MVILLNQHITTVDGLIVNIIPSVNSRPRGLHSAIIQVYPQSDVSSINNKLPGDLYVINNVAHIVGQKYRGYHSNTDDNCTLRKEWFICGLEKLLDYVITNCITKVYFPYQIGCEIGGQHWNEYSKIIYLFADVYSKYGQIYICQER